MFPCPLAGFPAAAFADALLPALLAAGLEAAVEGFCAAWGLQDEQAVNCNKYLFFAKEARAKSYNY